jgi:hypothetical protein
MQVSQPVDLATLLSRVDARLYSTTHQFLADVALIPQASAIAAAGGGEAGAKAWKPIKCYSLL